MKVVVTFFLLWLPAGFTILANPVLPDTAVVAPEKKPLVKPVFNFDSRYSFIDRETVYLNGLKLGLEWKEKVRTGLGIYLLSTTFTKELEPLPETTDPVKANLRFGYFAGYTEYVLYRTSKWEFSTPMQVGVGTLYYDYKDARGRSRRTDRQTIFLLEPSLTGHYKFFNWLGVGAGAGYRQILNPENRLAHNLNAPVFYVRGKLFLGELYKGLREKKNKKKAAG